MTRLHQIQDEVRLRSGDIAAAHGDWPCCKGCSDCCRQLASEPRVSREEWLPMAAAIDALPRDTAQAVRRRIREGAGGSRPVVCPLLDAASGSCLIYEARPVACRAYGFYSERAEVLGCGRIEAISTESSGVVWGNHATLEERSRELGPAVELSTWLDASGSRS